MLDQLGTKWDNIIKFLKDYYFLLVAIPLLIGGSNQLIRLLEIDPLYIRFFSSTQLLSDGLALMMFPLLLLSFALFYHLIFSSRLASEIFAYVVAPIFILVLILNTDVIGYEIPKPYVVIISILSVGGYGLILIFLLSKALKNKFLNKYSSNILGVGLILSITTLVAPLIVGKIDIEDSGFSNLESFKQEIQSDFNSPNFKVIYFNDNYIFVEHLSEKQERMVKVYEFERLFN